MEDISEIAREQDIWSFCIDVIDDKNIILVKHIFEDDNDTINYSKLIHPDYRKFDVLSTDQIAQIFIDNGDKIDHIFSSNKLQNYERLLCFKDETESKLISYLIDIKVAVETLYDKFRDAVKMKADVTEIKMLLTSIGKYRSSRRDKVFCDNCSSKTSISCYISVLLGSDLVPVSEKQIVESEVLVETARILLQGGGKINDPCTNGFSPLLNVVEKVNKRFALALFLIENGAQVNIKNTEEYRYLDFQPLYFAVDDCKSISLVEKIIEKGADLNAVNSRTLQYTTALHHACACGNEKAIELLIRKGANITLRDSDGKTPFATLIDNISRERAHLKILFIKEIAKAKFENRNVSPEDMEIIRKDPRLNILFFKCLYQLDKLKNMIFHSPFSYIDALNMRNKNVRKLVKLLRNENFIQNLAVNLSSNSLYNKDLMINFAEAEIIRRKYDKLDSILKSTLGKHLSSDLIMYIADYIGVQDLSLFTDCEL